MSKPASPEHARIRAVLLALTAMVDLQRWDVLTQVIADLPDLLGPQPELRIGEP